MGSFSDLTAYESFVFNGFVILLEIEFILLDEISSFITLGILFVIAITSLLVSIVFDVVGAILGSVLVTVFIFVSVFISSFTFVIGLTIGVGLVF